MEEQRALFPDSFVLVFRRPGSDALSFLFSCVAVRALLFLLSSLSLSPFNAVLSARKSLTHVHEKHALDRASSGRRARTLELSFFARYLLSLPIPLFCFFFLFMVYSVSSFSWGIGWS